MADTQQTRQESAPHRQPFRRTPAARLITGFIAGFVATALIWRREGALALLGGWAAFALTFTAWTWGLLWWYCADKTKKHASEEQMGHDVAVAIILIGASVSLWGVWVLFTRGHDPEDYAPRLLAVGSVVLSWLTIHTLFALIYAKRYYAHGHGGGIDFNRPHGHHDRPRFSDFFYLAFAIGVSFAISDTNLTSTRMRRVALGHSLLSFVFGSIIIASVVNLLSSR